MNLLTRITTGAVLAVSATLTQAAPLNLDIEKPDIFASDLDIVYNAGSQALTIDHSGSTAYFAQLPDESFQFFNTGSYDLNATVDNSGNLLSGGTFTLMGDISDGNGLQTLLAGNLTDMGFVAPTNNTEELLLEFIIDVTSTPVNALYDYGTTAGIIFSSKITSGATLPDVWSAGFFNSSNGKADDFKLSPVAATAPGGATLAMLAIGMASLVRLRRQ